VKVKYLEQIDKAIENAPTREEKELIHWHTTNFYNLAIPNKYSPWGIDPEAFNAMLGSHDFLRKYISTETASEAPPEPIEASPG